MEYYSRWTTKDELEKYLTKVNKGTKLEKSGIPMMYDKDTMYIDSSEVHTMVIGATGSGKSQAISLPQIKLAALAGESLIINDINGELYKCTSKSLENENYNIKVINLNSPNDGNNYNPLYLPYLLYKEGNKDKSLELIEKLGYYLFNDPKDKSDSFWLNSTIDYFTGLTLYLFENGTEEEINLKSIYNISAEGEELIDGKRKIENILNNQDKNSSIYIMLSGTVNAPLETRGGIIATFNQKLIPYITKENLSNMLSLNDIDFKTIQNNKTAIFIINKNNELVSKIVPLFIDQVIQSVDIYGNKKKRLNIILDEFSRLLPIKDLSFLMNFCRSINIRITVILNSYIELINTYGKEESEIIKYCFSNIIYLISNDDYTLLEISKLCGNTLDKKTNKPIPLISKEQLKTLKQFETIILKMRFMPIKTNLIPDYKIDWSLNNEITETLPKRTIKEIKIFNI